MHIDKKVLKELPKVVTNDNERQYAEYVMLVLSGMEKKDAFKEVFPDRYKIAVERAGGNQRVVGANVKKGWMQVERTNVCKKLYETAHKTWWVSFLDKKNKLYENLYDMAIDSDIQPRDRIHASKVMLEHMPTFKEDINVKVEVKQTKEDFVNHLREIQLSLQKTAVEDEITDIEVVENGN